MLEGKCHCGAVRVAVPDAPATLTNCNCSICRRYGTLWAYYSASTVQIQAPHEGLVGYSWGDRELRFVRCANCGCVMFWEGVDPKPDGRMGVNMRNFDPDGIGEPKIRRLDGAVTWKFLD